MRTSKSKNQDWYRWEEEVCNLFNGKPTPLSGATPYKKGDFDGKDWFIDCKFSKSNSFSIKNSLFEKYETIAKLEDKDFMIALNLNNRKLGIIDLETLSFLYEFYKNNQNK